MAWFEYEGLTQGGTAISGKLEATRTEQAREDLGRMGIDVRALRPAATPPAAAAGISTEDLIFFNDQLATLAEAGIALDEGLAQMARDVHSRRLRGWIEAVVDDLRRGVPIERAIAARESGLPVLYSEVIRAGIQSGRLSATLLGLNQHLRLTSSTRQMLWELLTYPIIVAVFGLLVVSIFFLRLVPQFKGIYQDFGTQLPGLTVLAIQIGAHYHFILASAAVMVALVALLWRGLRTSRGGLRIREGIVLRMPVIGRVYRASLIARFLRATATSIASGVPLPDSLRLASGATGSQLLEADAEYVASEVEQGHPVFVASQSTRLIPALFGYAVQVAVGRQALPAAIAQLADDYEKRALHSQSLMRVVILPISILLIGGLLGIAVVSLFLPLVSLINSVSGG